MKFKWLLHNGEAYELKKLGYCLYCGKETRAFFDNGKSYYCKGILCGTIRYLARDILSLKRLVYSTRADIENVFKERD